MTTENLVTIDFDSENVNSENSGLSPKNKNHQKSHQKNLLEDTDVIFSDNILEDEIERIPNESQPLLGGGDHHDTHQIIYNQFPSKSFV